MYKVFLVLGGESSGTRLATKFLINGGVNGSADHVQPYDKSFTGAKTPLVWRRSFPHDRKFVDIEEDMVKTLFTSAVVEKYRDILFLVTVRNWLCAEFSAVDHTHSYDKTEAHYRNQQGYLEIFKSLSVLGCDYEIVPMESFIYEKVFYVPYLYKRCGLYVPYESQKRFISSIKNTNEKHLWRYLHVQREKEVCTESNKAGEYST